MENIVTLTLERYHELLDKSEELKAFKQCKVKRISIEDFGMYEKIEYIEQDRALSIIHEKNTQLQERIKKYASTYSSVGYFKRQNDLIEKEQEAREVLKILRGY